MESVNTVKIETGQSVKNIYSLRKEISELKGQLAGLQEGTKEYNDTLTKLASAQHNFNEINRLTRQANADLGQVLSNTSSTIAGAAGAVNMMTNMLGLMGGLSSEAAEKALKLTIALMGITSGASAIDAGVKGLKGLAMAAKGAGGAMKLLTNIMKANPYVAAASAIMAVVAGLGALIKSLDKSEEREKQAIATTDKWTESLKRQNAELQKRVTAESQLSDAEQHELNMMKARGVEENKVIERLKEILRGKLASMKASLEEAKVQRDSQLAFVNWMKSTGKYSTERINAELKFANQMTESYNIQVRAYNSISKELTNLTYKQKENAEAAKHQHSTVKSNNEDFKAQYEQMKYDNLPTIEKIRVEEDKLNKLLEEGKGLKKNTEAWYKNRIAINETKQTLSEYYGQLMVADGNYDAELLNYFEESSHSFITGWPEYVKQNTANLQNLLLANKTMWEGVKKMIALEGEVFADDVVIAGTSYTDYINRKIETMIEAIQNKKITNLYEFSSVFSDVFERIEPSTPEGGEKLNKALSHFSTVINGRVEYFVLRPLNELITKGVVVPEFEDGLINKLILGKHAGDVDATGKELELIEMNVDKWLQNYNAAINTTELSINYMYDLLSKLTANFDLEGLMNSYNTMLKDNVVIWKDYITSLSNVANGENPISTKLLGVDKLDFDEVFKQLTQAYIQYQQNIDKLSGEDALILQLEYEKRILEEQRTRYENQLLFADYNKDKELENLKLKKDSFMTDVEYENAKLEIAIEYGNQKIELQKEIFENEKALQEKTTAIYKAEAAKRKKAQEDNLKMVQESLKTAANIAGTSSDLIEAFAEKDGRVTEREAQRIKNWKIGEATINAISGAISAYTSTLSGVPAPANMILAPINAAVALASGMAAVQQIRNTDYTSGSSSVSASYAPNATSISTLTTDTNMERQTQMSNDIAEIKNGSVKVYVTTSDINNAQNTVRTAVRNSTF